MKKAYLYAVFAALLAIITLTTAAPAAFAAAPTLVFNVSPSSITAGQSISISWSTTYALSCSASGGWAGSVNTYGSAYFQPTQTTQYAINCAGPEGSVSSSETVIVSGSTNSNTNTYTLNNTTYNPAYNYSPVTVTLNAYPEVISQGGTSLLSWNSSNASYCFGSGGWSGYQGLSGSNSVAPSTNTTYTLVCGNSNTSMYASKTITIAGQPNNTSTNFTVACVASPTTVATGEDVTFAAATTGGNGNINYQWSGDVGGTDASRTVSFQTTGTKTGSVSATDTTGRKIQTSCTTNVIQASQTVSRAKAPVTTASVDTKGDAYDAICIARGYTKPGDATLTQNLSDNARGFAASIGAFAGNPLVVFLMITMLAIAATAYIVYSLTKKTV